MLESVAKTKWCPIIKCGNYCVGSACMMFIVAVEGSNDVIDVYNLDSSAKSYVKRETEGYCGLARRV